MKNTLLKPEYLLIVVLIALLVLISVEATRMYLGYKYSSELTECRSQLWLIQHELKVLKEIGIEIHVMDSTKYRLVSGVEEQ